MDVSLNRWFASEVLVHEVALTGYLKQSWRNHEDIADLRQEIYVRVYESARTCRPTAPKAFLFTTARHLIIDRARRGRVVSIEAAGGFENLNVLIDEISPEQRLSARQELKELASAFGRLPPRCREVVWFRKVDGLSQNEVAQKLSISVRTVEFQVQKGMRILADVLSGGATRRSKLQCEPDENRKSEDGIN